MALATARSFFIIFIVLLLAGCGDDDKDQASQPPSGVEQEISQFSMSRSQDGRVRWKMNADATTLMESDQVRVKGVKLVIFGDKEGETLTLHSDQGEVNERTYDIRLIGNVEGISSDGGRLNTEEIYWRDITERIYTLPGIKVTLTFEDSVIVGEELEANPELETWSLKRMTGITRAEEKESENAED